MSSASIWTSLKDLFQSYTWILENISSPNCIQCLIIISAGFTFLMIRNLIIMCCTTAKGTTYSLIIINTDKRQVDKQDTL